MCYYVHTWKHECRLFSFWIHCHIFGFVYVNRLTSEHKKKSSEIGTDAML